MIYNCVIKEIMNDTKEIQHIQMIYVSINATRAKIPNCFQLQKPMVLLL